MMRLLLSTLWAGLLGWVLFTVIPAPPTNAGHEPPYCYYPGEGNTVVLIDFDWGQGLQTPGSAWRIAWETADQDWEDAATNKNIIFYIPIGGSNNDINSVYDPADPAYGWVDPPCPASGEWEVWHALDNTASTSGFDSNQRRGVAGHELGHVIGLSHAAVTNALMYTPQQFLVYYLPQQDDIDHADSIYNN